MIAEEAALRLDGSVDWANATRWHSEPNSFRPLAKATSDRKLLPIVNDHLGTVGRLMHQRVGAGAAERRYGWDKAGAPTSIDDAVWGQTRYQYDVNG